MHIFFAPTAAHKNWSTSDMEDLTYQLLSYTPENEQEARDREQILQWLGSGLELYSRDCAAAHLTASAWVVSPNRKKVLMAYHNLYHSWAWTGGHADGDRDLSNVAQRECMEESGIRSLRQLMTDIFSLEILSVDGHEKRGKYVSTHLHLNITFLFEAEETEALTMKPDENSGVAWIPVSQLPEKVSEPWMLERIYSKLCRKVRRLGI